jgi:hypothetical protein
MTYNYEGNRIIAIASMLLGLFICIVVLWVLLT